MAVSGNARDLYVANVWGQCVSKVDLIGAHERGGLLAGGRQGERHRRARPNLPNRDSRRTRTWQPITKRAEALLDPTKPDAPFPYACRLDERRQLFYVSLWAQAAVAVIDLKSNQVTATWADGGTSE